MNSIDIYEKSWIDLVFDGKNKAYGAYQLRRESSKTTFSAFCYGLLLVGALAGLFILSGFINHPTSKPTIGPDILIRPVQLKPRIPEPLKPQLQTASKPTASKPNLPPVVAAAPEADPEPEPMKNPGPSTPSATDNGGNGAGSTIPAVPGTATSSPDAGGGIRIAATLDKLPEFPGGISRFYTYVGNNFGKTDIGDQKTIRIFVTFVIEKDGSMTDIRVPRDPGFGLGNEAIRVLKSLKTKWAPGLIGGQPVRTAYSLPITVMTE